HTHFRVEAALFGQVTPLSARHLADIPAIPGDPPTIGAQDIQDHAHRRRFACSIGPQETEKCALFHFHRKVFDGLKRPKPFVDVLNLKTHRLSLAPNCVVYTRWGSDALACTSHGGFA